MYVCLTFSENKITNMPKRKTNNNVQVQNPSVDFSKLTVALLKNECVLRSLETSGRKADLIQRYDLFDFV